MVIGPWRSATNNDRKYQPRVVTAASYVSKMFYAYMSCCFACSASSNPSRRLQPGRNNESWATHGLPFWEMPARGTGEDRMAVAFLAQSISERSVLSTELYIISRARSGVWNIRSEVKIRQTWQSI